MSAQILSGIRIANEIHQTLKMRIEAYNNQGFRSPGLAVVLVGKDPASCLYVNKKHQACLKVGILSKSYELEPSVSQKKLEALIHELNDDPAIDGILVQMPLPTSIHTQDIVEKINPTKDVDGFHPYNLGRLVQRCPLLRPCTPAGVMTLIQKTGQNIQGLNATVVGASNIVGRPMALELLMAGCTVTICHSLTRDLANAARHADILVSAAGKAKLIQGDWIKPGAIVIDVGMNRMDNGSFRGDVDFESAKEKAGWISPVPGGVGPMTVATLLSNTLYAYETLHLKLGTTR